MNETRLRRLAAWLAAAWAGAMAGMGFVVAPILFATLPRPDAGRVAARVFEVDAQIGVVAAALLFVACMQVARVLSASGSSRFSSDMMLALAAMFCIVFGYFGLQPMLPAARIGQGPVSFAALHGAASLFFLAKFLLASVLAWRLGAPPASGVAATPAATTS